MMIFMFPASLLWRFAAFSCIWVQYLDLSLLCHKNPCFISESIQFFMRLCSSRFGAAALWTKNKLLRYLLCGSENYRFPLKKTQRHPEPERSRSVQNKLPSAAGVEEITGPVFLRLITAFRVTNKIQTILSSVDFSFLNCKLSSLCEQGWTDNPKY